MSISYSLITILIFFLSINSFKSEITISIKNQIKAEIKAEILKDIEISIANLKMQLKKEILEELSMLFTENKQTKKEKVFLETDNYENALKAFSDSLVSLQTKSVKHESSITNLINKTNNLEINSNKLKTEVEAHVNKINEAIKSNASNLMDKIEKYISKSEFGMFFANYITSLPHGDRYDYARERAFAEINKQVKEGVLIRTYIK